MTVSSWMDPGIKSGSAYTTGTMFSYFFQWRKKFGPMPPNTHNHSHHNVPYVVLLLLIAKDLEITAKILTNK